jgi:hypothetical protein
MNLNPAEWLRKTFGVKSLRKLLRNSYFRFRIGIGLLALLLTPVLWLVGEVFLDVELQDSLSDYYNADPLLRDLFVGVLFAVGVFLILYKGFTWLEDWALTFAGIAAVAVALLPVGKSDWHGVAAIVFFVCSGYVVMFRSSDTLTKELMANHENRKYWVLTYQALNGLTLLLIAIVTIAGLRSDRSKLTLLLEAIAITTFALYWILKSVEIERSKAGTDIRQKLTDGGYSLKDVVRSVPIRTL